MFAGFGFDVDGVDGKFQKFRQPLSDLFLVGRKFRLLGVDCAVEIDRLPASFPDTSQGVGQEPGRVGSGESGVCVWESIADVAEASGSQQGIGNGMQQDVRIAVAQQAAVEVDFDPAQDQGPVGRKAMRIVSQTNP